VVPEGVRDALYKATPGPLKGLRRNVIRWAESTGRHDEIYDKAYYDKFVEPTMAMSAEAIAQSITATFAPRSVIDVGCGTGLLLASLARRGVSVVGLEYSVAALELCRARGLDVRAFDIENEAPPPLVADLVVSTEVAEHLPEACAGRYVDLLCRLSDTVVMSAAVPGSGGTDHTNEQPNQYWIDRLEAKGRSYESDLSEAWRHEWKKLGVAQCFYSSLMIFSRKSNATSLAT
jgi:SAM-dependent methyltransferase